jgi:hypothetical protein
MRLFAPRNDSIEEAFYNRAIASQEESTALPFQQLNCSRDLQLIKDLEGARYYP